MKTQRSPSALLPIIAGAFAFLFASLPLSLGKDIHDRQQDDPQAQGYRRDRTLADKIKASLAEDDSLSAEAKNVRVLTNNGNVILKGKVATAAEKAKVEEITKEVSSTALIENDLKVFAR